jgi:hypothetical protein
MGGIGSGAEQTFPRRHLVENQERLDIRQVLGKGNGGSLAAADKVAVGGSGFTLNLIRRHPGTWFECPGCGRTARIVYPAFGFVCVRCTPCDYLCRHNHAGHAAARAAQLRAKLGAGPALIDELPPRARGRWRRKYLRRVRAIAKLEERILADTRALCDRFERRARVCKLMK